MRRLPATTLYYSAQAWLSLAFAVAWTVSPVYFVLEVGMNPLELVLVGTAMELAIFVFEVPTGVVADTYSRRLSIVIGWIVMGLGLVLAGLIPHVAAVIGGGRSGDSATRSQAAPNRRGSRTRWASSASAESSPVGISSDWPEGSSGSASASRSPAPISA